MSETPTTIYVQWSDDGQHIRKWSHEPFDGGTAFVPADTITALRAEVEQLRRALEHIVERSLNDPIGTSKVIDMRKIARAALTQTKDTTDTPLSSITGDE